MFTPQDHTFVVCAYKENPYIGDTIASLQAQTAATRVILSTSTPYDAAETPLVTMAHQDDYYDPTFVERMLAALNTYDASELLIGFTDYFEMRDGERVDNNTLLRIKRVMNAPLAHRCCNGSTFVKKRILSLGDPICCHAGTLVKQNLGASPFDTTYKNSCDYKTWVDFARMDGRFVYVPEALVGHRIYAESATSLNLGEDIR